MLKRGLIPTRLTTDQDVPRVHEISPLKARLGSFWLRVARFLFTLFWLKVTFRATAVRKAVVLRSLMEDLGGIWIKAGQILAMRVDLFEESFCNELSNLHDRAAGFPYSEVRRIVEQELGARTEEIFEWFEEEPIAAASIGQVHKARLRREGVTVAVKVQRPSIQAGVRRDLRMVGRLVWLTKLLQIMPHVNWNDMYWELSEIVLDELDYVIEAASIQRLRKNLKRHKVYAPRAFREYCGPRVLVMEYIEGVFMSDYIKMAGENPEHLRQWCEENEIRPKKVGMRLYFSQLRQIFEDNLFHGDIHPGNIVLLRKSRVALLDFGAVGKLEENFRFRYSLLLRAIVSGDYAKAAEIFLVLSPHLPPIELEEVKTELIRRFQQWELRSGIKTLPYHTRSFTGLVSELTKVLLRYKIIGNWQYLRVDRSLLTLDASLIYLVPTLNAHRTMRRYQEGAIHRSVHKALEPRSVAYRTANWLDLTLKTAELVPEGISFTAERIRKEATNFRATTNKYAYALQVLAGIAMTVFGVGYLLIALIFLHQAGAIDLRPYVTEALVGDRVYRLLAIQSLNWQGFTTWFVILAFGYYVFWSLLRIRRRMREKDYWRPEPR